VTDSAAVLARALDQVGDLLHRVRPEGLGRSTPCADWTLGDLADHVVASPANFTTMLRGDQPDWSAAPEHHEDGWAPAFRSAADALVQQLEATPEGGMDPDWMTAEFAVHTWDLARALGVPTADLDPEVAERGLAFMRANMRPEMRGDAFGPEQPAPESGDVYDTIAAFAGRVPTS